MGMAIAVTSGVLATLLEEAVRAHPLECCGLLLGRGLRIETVQPCANLHPQPERHFEIDLKALIVANRAARAGGPEVLGYYHSHPSGSTAPSATDRALASGDGRVWAIVAGGEIGWWRDGPKGFVTLTCRLTD
jgi:desampylase